MVESLKAEAKTNAMSFIQDTVEEAKMTAQQEAKKIIINTYRTGKQSPYRDWETDRKSTRLNSSHLKLSRMPSSA